MPVHLFDETLVPPEEAVYLDNSDNDNDSVRVEELSGDFNARLYIQSWDDDAETWRDIGQLDSSRMRNNWLERGVDVVVVSGERRLKVFNASKKPGHVEGVGVII